MKPRGTRGRVNDVLGRPGEGLGDVLRLDAQKASFVGCPGDPFRIPCGAFGSPGRAFLRPSALKFASAKSCFRQFFYKSILRRFWKDFNDILKGLSTYY